MHVVTDKKKYMHVKFLLHGCRVVTFATCVRSCLMHGSETWPMKVEHELKQKRTEMSMIRWMCGLS